MIYMLKCYAVCGMVVWGGWSERNRNAILTLEKLQIQFRKLDIDFDELSGFAELYKYKVSSLSILK
jgi:hypothetical protein